MLYRNVLVPYDSSESAKHALTEALRLVTAHVGTKVTVLKVSDPPEEDEALFSMAERMAGISNPNRKDIAAIEDEYLARAREVVEAEIAPIIGMAPNEVQVVARIGKPQRQIIKLANDGDYDLIVMGSRGLSAVRGMLGSVSFAVLRESKVPVLVVK